MKKEEKVNKESEARSKEKLTRNEVSLIGKKI